MIEALAQKLQALVEERRGIRPPILDHRWQKAAARPAEPAIRLTMYSAGDMYSGGTVVETIELVDMARPDIGRPLEVRFTYALHDSGQCDGWNLAIDGATGDEVTALRELFSPAQCGHFGENREPSLVVDDVEQVF